MSDLEMETAARRAIACLDLTDLNDDCDEAAVETLAARAKTPHGTVAALCVWPRFVRLARAAAPADVRVATVVAFPGGETPDDVVIAETEAALRAGADEIDVVIPYRLMMEGQAEAVVSRVARVKREAGQNVVKAILETGVLGGTEAIRLASELALEGGADFLKTSTGKAPVSATLAAAETMLEAIAAHDRPAGLKAAGGIRTAEEAASYLALADERMGEGWATPATFRFGASGLLDALLATLAGRDAAAAGEGY